MSDPLFLVISDGEAASIEAVLILSELNVPFTVVPSKHHSEYRQFPQTFYRGRRLGTLQDLITFTEEQRNGLRN